MADSFMSNIGSRYGITAGSRENTLYNALWVAQALLRKGYVHCPPLASTQCHVIFLWAIIMFCSLWALYLYLSCSWSNMHTVQTANYSSLHQFVLNVDVVICVIKNVQAIIAVTLTHFLIPIWTLANPHSSFENFQICEDRQKTNSYIHQ